MIYRYFVREGMVAEQHRQEVLVEVARLQAVAEARRARTADPRPLAAPGSFLVFVRKYFAMGRFRPAQPPAIRPSTEGPPVTAIRMQVGLPGFPGEEDATPVP